MLKLFYENHKILVNLLIILISPLILYGVSIAIDIILDLGQSLGSFLRCIL